jgi:septum formation protein
MNKPLILGSNSPRRKEILGYFAIPFKQHNPEFDETQVLFHGDARAFASEVARRKALSLAHRFPDELILTADTVVYQNGKLFLKPESLQEAHSMLAELQGKEHRVLTGVCVIGNGKCFVDAEESRVFFHQLTDTQIHTYHSHIDPLDKAGGYAIQRGGSLIVKRIEGCYYNIMGLPIGTVRALLLKAGVDLWEYLKSV